MLCHKLLRGLVVCFAVGAVALAGRGAAGEGRPSRLPAFDAVDREGSRVAAASLARDETWLLAYVGARPDDADPLLAILAREVPPERLAVIVAGVPEDAAAVAARFPELGPASWLADPECRALRALALGATPALDGLRGGAIEWRLPGAPAPGDAAAEERLAGTIRSWLGAETRPKSPGSDRASPSTAPTRRRR